MKHNLNDIATEVIIRETAFEKASGLMFRSKKYIEDKAMLFKFEKEQKVPLHMLFVFYPIDILWINSELEVIDMKKSAKPFALGVYHKGKAQYVIELPAKTLTKNKISLMDKIAF